MPCCLLSNAASDPFSLASHYHVHSRKINRACACVLSSVSRPCRPRVLQYVATDCPEREEILTQAVWTVSLVCEASDTGVGYFNRTSGFQVVVAAMADAACPGPVFAAIGTRCRCSRDH